VSDDPLSGLESAINATLDSRQQQFVSSRWLDQLRWMDKRSITMQRQYYALRVTTIMGGVIAPALISFNRGWSHLTAAVVSLIVGISAAVEEFFHFGDRWRHYRQTAESLRAEGWKFLELADSYVDWFKKNQPKPPKGTDPPPPTSPREVFPLFVERVEKLIGREVSVFLSKIAEDPDETKPSH
jgi:hypothetical protein